MKSYAATQIFSAKVRSFTPGHFQQVAQPLVLLRKHFARFVLLLFLTVAEQFFDQPSA